MESELHMRARMQQGMKRAAEAAGSAPEAREPLPGGAGMVVEMQFFAAVVFA